MPKKRASLDPSQPTDDPIQPRRSTRVSSKPNSTNSTATIKSNKKTNKVNQSDDVKKADSPSGLESTVGDPVEEDDQPVQKKLKIDGVEDGKKKLSVGDQLIDDEHSIVLRNHEDVEVDISDLIKEKGTIFFVYPKANTPGCTNQACGFRDLHDQIVEQGFQVLGLSMDLPKSQKNWKEKQNLPYDLLCDPKQELIKLIGGSKSSTQVQRSHYIIQKGGKILNLTIPSSPKTGPQEALDFIKEIKSSPPSPSIPVQD